jgi:hypothetical protein
MDSCALAELYGRAKKTAAGAATRTDEIEATAMNIEPPKRRATDFCAGVKSVLAFLGGVLVLLMVLVSIGIATAHQTPGQHNEQWFFSQVCPHSSQVDSHARPEMPEVFF